jgi:hypothetical protein
MSNKLLKEHNDLLLAELGPNPNGEPWYRWARAGELTYLSHDGTFEYTADPETGLLAATRKLVQRKMRPDLDDKQWVLMFWTENLPQFWFQFGQSMYGFTNVFLDPGIEPWTMHKGHSFTQYVIGLIKEQRTKSMADWNAEGEAIQSKAHKASMDLKKDIIRDAIGPYLSVPGSHGHHHEFQAGIGDSKPHGGLVLP